LTAIGATVFSLNRLRSVLAAFVGVSYWRSSEISGFLGILKIKILVCASRHEPLRFIAVTALAPASACKFIALDNAKCSCLQY
jgi:hypothetical protein